MIGLGSMGSAMARKLVKAGFDVWVFDIRPEPIHALVAEGAHAAASPQDLGAKANFVFSVLLNFPQTQQALMGDTGVLAGMQPGGDAFHLLHDFPGGCQDRGRGSRGPGGARP